MRKLSHALRALLIAAFAAALFPAVNAKDWDEQPSVAKSVSPENPNKVTGMVSATIEIDEKGFVTSAQIEKSTDAALEQPVLEAVKEWRFNPAKKGGQPVSCKIRVPFQFKS